jgi:hypothetical protein
VREQLLATGGMRGTRGQRRHDVEEYGEVQRRVGSGGGAGTARVTKRGGAGQLELGHMAGEGSGVGKEKTERGRTGARRRWTLLQIIKSAGTLL